MRPAARARPDGADESGGRFESQVPRPDGPPGPTGGAPMLPVFQEWTIIRPTAAPSRGPGRFTFAASTPRKIGVDIQQGRIKNRLTIARLAELCGTDARTIAMYENGSETPCADTIRALERVLSVDLRAA